MKVKFQGPHPNIFDSLCFRGLIFPGDIIEMDQETFDRNKHRTHNDKPIWTEEKQKKQKKEVAEVEAENTEAIEGPEPKE